MTAGGPHLTEWRALYEAASQFKSIECWTWMDDSMLFGVQNPADGDIGYCCILGNAGISYGLNVYLGTEGLMGYATMAKGRVKGDESLFLPNCLAVAFDDRASLGKEDLGIIEALGLGFRGPHAWPCFRHYSPGYYPWFLEPAQVRFLTMALEQSKDVALRIREDGNLPVRGKRDEFLVRRLDVKPTGTEWVDDYIVPGPLKARPKPDMHMDHSLLAQAGQRVRNRDGTWEVEYVHVAYPLQDKPGQRPFFPKALAVVDGATGFVLHTQLIAPHEPLSVPRNELLKAMLSNGVIPSTVLLKRPEAMDIVFPLANALSFEVLQVKTLKEAGRFLRGMVRMLEKTGLPMSGSVCSSRRRGC